MRWRDKGIKQGKACANSSRLFLLFEWAGIYLYQSLEQTFQTHKELKGVEIVSYMSNPQMLKTDWALYHFNDLYDSKKYTWNASKLIISEMTQN